MKKLELARTSKCFKKPIFKASNFLPIVAVLLTSLATAAMLRIPKSNRGMSSVKLAAVFLTICLGLAFSQHFINDINNAFKKQEFSMAIYCGAPIGSASKNLTAFNRNGYFVSITLPKTQKNISARAVIEPPSAEGWSKVPDLPVWTHNI